MTKELLTKGTYELFNIFTTIYSYTVPDTQFFTGYLYLDKMLMGDTLHLRILVNDNPHLYLEYKDQQSMVTVYINPIPLLPGDTLIFEGRNLSTNLRMLPLTYVLYTDIGH